MGKYRVGRVIKSYVSRSVFFYELWFHTYRRHKGSYIRLPDPSDHFYIDGYPRSGNTYTAGYLKKAFPELNFASHLHTVAALKISLRLHIPSFIIVRAPEEAVCSNLYRKVTIKEYMPDKRLIGDMFMNYIMYYEMVIKNMELDYLHIITFASCVKKEIEVIQRVSKVLEIPTRGKTQLENLLNEYKNEMQLEETKK
jgi:hypothetical protein